MRQPWGRVGVVAPFRLGLGELLSLALGIPSGLGLEAPFSLALGVPLGWGGDGDGATRMISGRTWV